MTLRARRNKVLAVLLSVAFTVALSGPALADVDPASGLTNVDAVSGVYADALLTAAVAVGDIYWEHQGYAPICPAEVDVYDEQDGATVARGDMPGCRVYFDRQYRNDVWALVNDRHETRSARLDKLGEACAIATHERGHNHGLDHTTSGIMTPVQTVVPAECADWARTILPLKRNRDKRARRH